MKKYGSMWVVLWESEYVPALTAPGFFVQPFIDDHYKRWICLDGAPHFIIKEKD